VFNLISKSVLCLSTYASAVYAAVMCPSVRPSQAGTVKKQLNIGSHKQHL